MRIGAFEAASPYNSNLDYAVVGPGNSVYAVFEWPDRAAAYKLAHSPNGQVRRVVDGTLVYLDQSSLLAEIAGVLQREMAKGLK